jgi:hypothetical protein
MPPATISVVSVWVYLCDPKIRENERAEKEATVYANESRTNQRE